jgi:hypothetical protein
MNNFRQDFYTSDKATLLSHTDYSTVLTQLCTWYVDSSQIKIRMISPVTIYGTILEVFFCGSVKMEGNQKLINSMQANKL